MSSIKVNFDKEKLDILLGYFEQGQISMEQAEELKTMLEELHEKAIDDGDLNTARDIASILITLKGILTGMISFNPKSFTSTSFH